MFPVRGGHGAMEVCVVFVSLCCRVCPILLCVVCVCVCVCVLERSLFCFLLERGPFMVVKGNSDEVTISYERFKEVMFWLLILLGALLLPIPFSTHLYNNLPPITL